MDQKEVRVAAGDLGLVLGESSGGITLLSLRDLALQREWLALDPPPLFSLTLRRVGTKEERTLAADVGWRSASITPAAEGIVLEWTQPADEALVGISVHIMAVPEAGRHVWHWTLRVDNVGGGWSIWRVVFPQLTLAKPGDDAVALAPAGPGQLVPDAWERAFRQEAKYPGGWWWGLQFMAAYAALPAPTGLYIGAHDPLGGVKDLLMEGDPQARAVRLSYDHPAPDMGRPGNSFSLGGEVVWQLYRGDWYDAAMIYKDWARHKARWWPPLSDEGRADTPLWMRELSLWAMGGWNPEVAPGQRVAATVEQVRELQHFMGIPMGLHWYRWHQIPFDNDYPHFFPAMPGFAEGVAELQRSQVRIMPYINGRLWDTRDRGSEDFEFSHIALPAATKDEDGQPYVETYGSKEADGSPVQLAAMCPTTELWRSRVRELVLRLFDECGVDGVYIDQVAAAASKLCMDPTHGHPLGGGHWWNEGYWQMMEAIRRDTPAERMVTTECNAEVFVRWFDGYLTWHWQQDNMVPVFPAVYGGTIQMFGRAYGGKADAREPTQALAWRMRAGQQFVFGEQIGWFNTNLANEHMPMSFIRDLARLRWRLRRYFYAGEMARPPKLVGHNPRLRANWQWGPSQDNPWVTTDALLCSAWRMRGEDRLVLLFANVSEEDVAVELRFDGDAYGLSSPQVQVTSFESDGTQGETLALPGRFTRPITVGPYRALALEVEPR